MHPACHKVRRFFSAVSAALRIVGWEVLNVRVNNENLGVLRLDYNQLQLRIANVTIYLVGLYHLPFSLYFGVGALECNNMGCFLD